MKRLYVPILIVIVFCLAACDAGQGKRKRRRVFAAPDTTINVNTAFNNRFLDSQSVLAYIQDTTLGPETSEDILDFYRSRGWQYAWFAQHTINEHTPSFVQLVNGFAHMTEDSSFVDHELLSTILNWVEDTVVFRSLPEAALAKADMALTRQFFRYANDAYGGKIEPSDIQWFIPRKKINALSLLDTLIAHKGQNTADWEPLNPFYQSLKKQLVYYQSVKERGGWHAIPPIGKRSLKTGDADTVIALLKKRLMVTGDYGTDDTSMVFTEGFDKIVSGVQSRFGIKADGIIRDELIGALNVPVTTRITQMLINLERTKWLPEKTSPKKIVVNIPEFAIHVFEGDTTVLNMRVVVGKAGTGTVVFSDMLKYVVFNPYWNVPSSIVRNEIYPAMKRNPAYLRNHNMEQTGTSGGLPIIRQKPGNSNALGRVKFLFPNNYNIYFHDSPAKSLFDREKRAFSHGCIRLAEPAKMAEYILKDYPEWPADKIKAAMSGNKEVWVTLKEPTPVYITYFTSWVGADGKINFREDLYGHDKKMAEKLFLNAR